MKKHVIVICLLIITAFTTVTALNASQTTTLKENPFVYMTEEYPPYNFTKDDKVQGISPDLLRKMWEKMGLKANPIKMLPWARGYKLTLHKKNHVLMSMTRIPEREPLFKWVGPIATSKYVLIKLTLSDIAIDSLNEAKKFKIANIRGDATGQILISSGCDENKIIEISKVDHAIKMLNSGRINLIAFEEKSFFKVVKELHYDTNDFQSVFVLKVVDDYFAFNKDTPNSTITQFQTALDSLGNEHKLLLDKYMD